MSWRVVDHTTIYHDPAWFAGHPNVVRAPNGDLLALFHRSPDPAQGDENYKYPRHAHPTFDVRACRSTDEGKTWGPALGATHNPRGGVLDFGTHTLSDGSIFMHISTVELVPQEGDDQRRWIPEAGTPFWVRSGDSGVTWSEPQDFPDIPGALNRHPASHRSVCRSGLIELPGGRLLMPGKATSHPEGMQPYYGTLLASDDFGQTWDYAGGVACDDEAHFSEPAAILTPKGRVVVLYRCQVKPGDTESLCLSLVYSDDAGVTWSKWQATKIVGSPGHLLALRDGRVLLTVGTRWPGQQGCLAYMLDSEVSNIDTAQAIVVRDDSAVSDCGYPWAVELENGNILIVYYYVDKKGTRHIQGSVLEEV